VSNPDPNPITNSDDLRSTYRGFLPGAYPALEISRVLSPRNTEKTTRYAEGRHDPGFFSVAAAAKHLDGLPRSWYNKGVVLELGWCIAMNELFLTAFVMLLFLLNAAAKSQ
jgi:hypothetical protein